MQNDQPKISAFAGLAAAVAALAVFVCPALLPVLGVAVAVYALFAG
ncbi:hypothetical protein [Streptomyces sp. NPDC049915]